MPTNSARITLLAPGCFSELPGSEPPGPERESESAGAAIPVAAADLNNATVVKTGTSCYEQALLARLGQPVIELGGLPIAQHRFRSDYGAKAPAHCVCAEFIHLQADTANARLIPSQALNISAGEAVQLVESLNELIKEDDLNIIQCDNGNMYLTGMPAAHLDTWPAHALATGKVANYLPRQSQAGDWRRLLTEIQMLFHAHPVNEARAISQQLPINAMWFWGGAQYNAHDQVSTLRLVATDTFAVGLADAFNIEPIQADALDWSQAEGDIVIVETGVYEAWLRGDYNGLRRAKKNLNTQWIEVLQQAVANKVYAEFLLDGCEGQAILETANTGGGRFSFKSNPILKWLSDIAAKSTSRVPGTPRSDKTS